MKLTTESCNQCRERIAVTIKSDQQIEFRISNQIRFIVGNRIRRDLINTVYRFIFWPVYAKMRTNLL